MFAFGEKYGIIISMLKVHLIHPLKNKLYLETKEDIEIVISNLHKMGYIKIDEYYILPHTIKYFENVVNEHTPKRVNRNKKAKHDSPFDL